MANFDFHVVARDLIGRLEADGRAADAAKLRSAMDEGATGTEILMALQFHLLEIARRDPFEGEQELIVARLLSELKLALE